MPEADSTEPDLPQPHSVPHKAHPQAKIRSIPSLAAALRETDKRPLQQTSHQGFSADALVPMYAIRTGNASEEAESVANFVTDLSERLRRMGAAYGEWKTFDSSAYFDLVPEQRDWLVEIVEQVSTVHVVFFVDLLLPSFRSAEAYWAERFYPAYQAVHAPDAQPAQTQADSDDFIDFFETVQPEMVQRWLHLADVAQQARQILIDDVGYLATNGSQEERLQHSIAWQQNAAPNIDLALRPTVESIPTLTLSFEFTLPAHRQPKRLQRLRRNREHSSRTVNSKSGE